MKEDLICRGVPVIIIMDYCEAVTKSTFIQENKNDRLHTDRSDCEVIEIHVTEDLR